MKLKHSLTAKAVSFSLVIFSAIMFTSASAQSTKGKTDEQIIRDMVAEENAGNHVIQLTDNPIFVSGAYPKPIIGKQVSEMGRTKLLTKDRVNFSQKYRIDRIVVAKAGDMAYDFGYGDLAWDTPEGKHVAFEASYVRVWRKVNGQWKGEVFFARPNDEGSSTAAAQ